MFTGGTTKWTSLGNVELHSLWSKLEHATSCGIAGVISSKSLREDTGPLNTYAYGILQLIQVGDVRLVKLSNSWNFCAVKGKWSRSSRMWSQNPTIADEAQFNPADETTFWLELDELQSLFTTFVECRLYTQSEWDTQRRRGTFPTDSDAHLKYPSWATNPQFYLKLEKDNDVVLTISQELQNGELNSLGLLVANFEYAIPPQLVETRVQVLDREPCSEKAHLLKARRYKSSYIAFRPRIRSYDRSEFTRWDVRCHSDDIRTAPKWSDFSHIKMQRPSHIAE